MAPLRPNPIPTSTMVNRIIERLCSMIRDEKRLIFLNPFTRAADDWKIDVKGKMMERILRRPASSGIWKILENTPERIYITTLTTSPKNMELRMPVVIYWLRFL